MQKAGLRQRAVSESDSALIVGFWKCLSDISRTLLTRPESIHGGVSRIFLVNTFVFEKSRLIAVKS